MNDEHDFEFVEAQDGKMVWRCSGCGATCIEYEDSQP